MNRILLPLLFALTLSVSVSAADKPNSFFAFDNGVGRGTWTPEQQAQILKESGYAGIGYSGTHDLANRQAAFAAAGLRIFNLYVPCHPAKATPYASELIVACTQLAGTDTMLWLTVQGKCTDKQAAQVVGEIADAAAKHDVKVALYPHHGFHVATARDAHRITQLANRKNLGLTFNLCHELRAGNAKDLPEIIRDVAPSLFLASINGADSEGSWDRLIRPLGEGSIDVKQVVQHLQTAGYTGPIGLQCYNVKGDQKGNLAASIKVWKQWSASP